MPRPPPGTVLTKIDGRGRIGLDTPHAYADTMSFGPFLLREIEWLEYPWLGPRREDRRPDLAALEDRLAALGRFPIEHTARGLRIVGHVRGPLQHGRSPR